MKELINKAFMKSEHCQAVSDWVDKNAITRFAFSPVCMASFYGLFLFMYEIVFLRETIPVVHPFLIAWAAVIATYDFVIRRNWTKLPGWKWLTWFSAACFVSVVTNMQAGIAGNVKGWVLSVLPLFAFYPLCQSAPKEQRTKVLIKVFLGASVAIFAASFVSLILYVLHFGGTVNIWGMENYIGLKLYDYRYLDSGVLLFGVYCDTNHASMYAIAFSLYSVFLFNECRKGLFKRKWQNSIGKLFAVANFVVQICYFPLANSRGGWLCLCVASVVVLFLYFNYVVLRTKRKWIKMGVSVIFAGFVTMAVCGSIIGIRTGMTQLSATVVDRLYSSQEESPETELPETELPETETPETETPETETPETETPEAETPETETPETETPETETPETETPETETPETESPATEVPTTEAPMTEPIIKNELAVDVAWGDFSKNNYSAGAGRIGFWIDALKLFTHRPIFGECPGNNQYYATLYGYENKIANGTALHNSYLDLLVDYGLVGFILLIGFWVNCLCIVLKRIINRGSELDSTYFIVCMIVLMAAGVILLLSCAFITTTAMYFMMLVMTGYLVAPVESIQDKGCNK